MCLWSERKVPALIVSGLSLVVVLCGFLLLVESIIFNTRKSILTTDLGEGFEGIQALRIVVFGVILVASVVTIMLGSLGVGCVCKPCNNRCCPFMYGTMLTLVWLVFVIVGGIVTGLGTAAPEAFDQVCVGAETGSSFQEFRNLAVDVDLGLQSINSAMCSQLCPCDAEAVAPWFALEESYLNTFNRTKTQPTSSDFFEDD